MIAYRDFVPKQLSDWTLFKLATYESLDAAVAAANEWISTGGVEVISVETVVLPNLGYRDQRSSDGVVRANSDFVNWNQFIRVWYRQS